MLRSSRTHALALAALIIAVAATGSAARQYRNSGNNNDVSMGVVPEVNDAPVTDANPLPVKAPPGGFPTSPAGSTGTDYSANAAAVPITGYVLLTTIPATPGRAFWEVQNQSGNTIQVVRDDGAGNQQTTKLLTGVGAGQQGGSTSSSTFKGRIRVYGPAGSQVAAYQD